mmetsp:Transcript_39256/g.116308  ORF Transcript_39256/g.116308 Transcript_39256/m.116308 type:complete len:255 (+) Transcript_39256:77-841(+)
MTLAEGQLLFMENEHYSLVDALPYIDTQLGQSEVAQQVKALIDEEMTQFEPRDYLASLPAPDLPLLGGEFYGQEWSRIDAGEKFSGVDITKYAVEAPTGPLAQDDGAWSKAAEGVNTQLEYNRLRRTNLEMLERWGKKAWIAHSMVTRAGETVLSKEAAALRASREEVNKKRKLDQVSCGNELRKLGYELEQYMVDNISAVKAVQEMESGVQRLRDMAADRGIDIDDVDPDYADFKKQQAAEASANAEDATMST